jgi:hypothetical protein
MADTDLTQIPYSATPDTRVSAIIARAHALLSVAHELHDDQPQLASAVNQLANDIMDDAEAVLAHFMEEAKADMAARGVLPTEPVATDE